jgi:hypothetical protein
MEVTFGSTESTGYNMPVKLIQSQTGNGGSNLITFSSIPQIYTHLYLVCTLRIDSAGSGEYANLRFNNNNDTFTSQIFLYNFQTASVNKSASSLVSFTPASGNPHGTGYKQTYEAMIINYSSSTQRKGVFIMGSAVGNSVGTSLWGYSGGCFDTNTAITTLYVTNGNTGMTWTTGTMFTLYGIS